MKSVLILGTGIISVFAISLLISSGRRQALTEDQLEAKVHDLKGKFRSLDEVKLEAATTGGDNAGYGESLHV